MMELTYWKDAPNRSDPEDFDGIRSVRLRTVKQIPQLIADRPANCTMISTEHPPRKLKSGEKTIFFKEVWRGPRGTRTICTHCNGTGRI